MHDILITGGLVVTMNIERQVIENGAVAITGNRITAVGHAGTVAGQAKTTIDAQGKAVLPGLIDGHAHAGHGLIKTMGGGDSNAWSRACEIVYTVGSTPDFWRAEAALAALERLSFGVTCGVSLLGGGDSIMRSDDPAHGVGHAEGVAQVGIRAIMAVGPTRPPHPRTYASWRGSDRREYGVDFDRQYDTTKTLLETVHGTQQGRMRVSTLMPVFHDGEQPADTLVLTEAQGRMIRELGQRHGTFFHQDGHRQGSIARAEKLGLLGPDATLSHCTELTEADIAALRRTDTRVVHNPSAIASVRGRCPAIELLDQGVTVILGSDATAPDRSGDMFRHMFMAMRYHQRHFRDQRVLPPGKALEMVTIDAARAMGMDGEIGSLEPGKKADVITVDLSQPHMYPPNMPLYRLVCFAVGQDVRDVVCDGALLLRDRRFMQADSTAILAAAAAETEAMLARTGLGHMLATPEGFWGRTRY
jgi:cytosine/adenosine deaminase-related metal-dependent hydrolase